MTHKMCVREREAVKCVVKYGYHILVDSQDDCEMTHKQTEMTVR